MLRALTLTVALAFAAPGMASATDDIVLLTHSGSPHWNAQMGELAVKVDKQKPTELALGLGTRATIAPAVERLKTRGVTNVTVIPLFTPAPGPDQVSGLALPSRVSPGVPD